ncbi:MAG: ABC transporter ATP-binding protein [Eubacteriales bacterium]|nr:ABC transporter ATP-binding protein [Eubacteriales bacterium]
MDNKKCEEILEISHVTNRYRDSGGLFSKAKTTRVLNDVSLTIHRDELFGLVGESGCGKSTLGKAVLGLIPYEGEIRVAGLEHAGSSRREFTSNVQAVFQDPLSSLNPRRTIAKTLEEPLLAHGIGTKESRRQKALEMLELVGLDATYADRLPRDLSGGQRQRVCIGAALMLDPDLVIADEATSALDVSVGAQILNLFQEIHERKDFAMLFISHNLNVVYYLCDRIAVMYRGSIVEQGDAESLYNNPRHPYTRMLLSAIPEIEESDELSQYSFEQTRREAVPEGCDFYHRCPYATEACKTRPGLEDCLDADPDPAEEAAGQGTAAGRPDAGRDPAAGGSGPETTAAAPVVREHLVRCWNPVK